jgi:hypothetical protein
MVRFLYGSALLFLKAMIIRGRPMAKMFINETRRGVKGNSKKKKIDISAK